jgi:cation diffusion facilitator CzcD-associated flavoprotein CzcO
MSERLNVAIIGAGPHGMSAGMHLRRAGIEAQVFGDAMSFWRSMPQGMFLRSNWSATNIAEPTGEFSLDSYQRQSGQRFGSPVPLDRFIDYGMWFQRCALPDLDRRLVSRVDREADGVFVLELEDGVRVRARRVVVAAGIAPFVARPAGFDGLPEDRVSHTGEHSDLAAFRGQRVAVIGGGQSALESAALAREAGAEVEVFIRRSHVIWLKAHSPKTALGPLGPVLYAPTDVGPLWYSRLVSVPELFRRLPRRAQSRIAYRSIRPACSNWVRVRLDGITLHLDTAVVGARYDGGAVHLTCDSGATRSFDRVLLGTGYRVDVARYPFLAPGIVAALKRVDGYPVLRRGLESVSIPRLHFVGAPAAWSFGPTLRFVSGSWYCGRSVAQHAADQQRVRAAGAAR